MDQALQTNPREARGATRVTGRPFLLIYGAPRSGTYLLSSRLQQTYDIAIPIETQFIPLFVKYKWAFGDLKDTKARRRLFKSLMWYTRLAISKSFRLSNPEQQVNMSILQLEDHSHKIAANSSDYASFVHALFAAYAEKNDRKVYADKSAFYAPYSLDT